HQLSQGAANWTVEPGDRFTYYKLVDSVVPPKLDADGHEADFFDGIDTTLMGLVARLGEDESKVPFLRPALVQLQADVDQASKTADADARQAVKPLLEGLDLVRRTIARLQTAGLDPAAAREVLTSLRTKETQFQTAANLSLGLKLEATVDSPSAAAEKAFMAVPGQSFTTTLALENPGKQSLSIKEIKLDVPKGWRTALLSGGVRALAPGEKANVQFRVSVAEDASETRPYWHRNDPERDSVNTVDQPQYATLALPAPPVKAHVTYEV